jgi:hypothetical protein
LAYYEIGPKTAALLFHAAFDLPSTLPTDSHVWYTFKKLQYTNANYPDECSWQAGQWMKPDYYIRSNDAIGSIRQTLANRTQRLILKRKVRLQKNSRLSELIELLM